MKVLKQFHFEAAHRLPHVPLGHQCGRLHGHSYRVDVEVSGPKDDEKGWVLDFAEVSEAVKPIVSRLDHHLLNDVSGLDNPTAENLAEWFYADLKRSLPGIASVTVWETATSAARYGEEDDV